MKLYLLSFILELIWWAKHNCSKLLLQQIQCSSGFTAEDRRWESQIFFTDPNSHVAQTSVWVFWVSEPATQKCADVWVGRQAPPTPGHRWLTPTEPRFIFISFSFCAGLLRCCSLEAAPAVLSQRLRINGAATETRRAQKHSRLESREQKTHLVSFSGRLLLIVPTWVLQQSGLRLYLSNMLIHNHPAVFSTCAAFIGVLAFGPTAVRI